MINQLEALSAGDFDQVWEIMEDSFPLVERRDYKKQKELLLDDAYHIYGCRNEKKISAFFAVWELEGFLFIEHFAVEKSCRNGGIGAALLGQLIKVQRQTVILEVELPAGALEQRRISFYERNGFFLNDYEYVQPAMSKERQAIPLKIMSYPKPLTKPEFERTRERLYKKVYNVSE